MKESHRFRCDHIDFYHINGVIEGEVISNETIDFERLLIRGLGVLAARLGGD